MRTALARVALGAALTLAGCSPDEPAAPGGTNQTAARFDELADSIAGDGDFLRADALRHAAKVVRLTGDPTPVTLTIDGATRAFVAVAEELEYPNIVCRWPADSGWVFPDSTGAPPDSLPLPPPPHPGPVSCTPEGSLRLRTLIAWEPERLAEVVRLVADQGRGAVEPGLPDPMAGPTHHGEGWGGRDGGPGDPTMPPFPSDSAILPPPHPDPGFMGEYLDRETGFWWSASGTQTNALEREGGACTRDEVAFDWARYACSAIRVRFEFAMRVQRMVPVPFDGWDPRDSLPPMPPVESRDIRMPATSIAGARLMLLEWLPPPIEPPFPGPMPPDSAGAMPGRPGGR